MILRALLTLLCVFPCAAIADAMLEQASRDIIVKWRTYGAALDAADRLDGLSARVSQVSPALPADPRENSGLERITVVRAAAPSDIAVLLDALSRDPQVEYAERRPIRHTCEYPSHERSRDPNLDGVPDDPYYNMLWGHEQIEIESAWNITRGHSSVVIAVVDLGVWFGHPDLAGQSWINHAERFGAAGVDDDNNGYVDDAFGYDFVNLDGDPTPHPLQPAESHGTHVAGIIAAVRNNALGIAGVAPECRVMGIRAGSQSTVPYGYEGIYYACRSGAQIINCSWGGFAESAYERDVVEYVQSRGCIVVAAAGNSAGSDRHFPAALPGVVGVAATRIGDIAANFTQYGSWVRVSAPGVSVVSTIIGQNGTVAYASWQGTSMASPYVAGLFGLVLSRFPSLDAGGLVSRALSSSDPIDAANPMRAGQLGSGRINAWRAVGDHIAGLRLADVAFSETVGNGDGRIRAGETAEIRVAVYNDLVVIPDAYGVISTTEDTVIVDATPSFWGEIPVGGPYWGSPPFRITLPLSSPRARILPLTIDFFGSNHTLLGRETCVLHLDPTYAAVDNGRMRLGFAENGSLGYYDYARNEYIGPGLRIHDRPSNALFHGSFVFAADGAVSDNAYGDANRPQFDWVPVGDSLAHAVPGGRADIEVRATFEDFQADQMLFARVHAAALGWTDPASNGFLILEYRITNRSVNPWTAAYAGFFLDWDLGSASGNLSHYDATSGIAYVSQFAPGHPLAGIVALNGAWNSFYTVRNRDHIDSSGWNDAFKWQMLTGGVSTQSPAQPMDVSHMAAVGPFSIAAHESLTVAFALLTGAGLDELRANAAAADARYAGREPVQPPAADAAPVVGLYPNPVAQGSALNLLLPQASSAVVRFYNILGRLVAEVPVSMAQTGQSRLHTAALNGASGLLFYRVESAAGNFSGKIFVVK